jgi:hypothetical protein
MEPHDILLDLFESYAALLRRAIQDLPREALVWQPDPQANNIAVTAWHMARSLDLLTVRLLGGRPAEEELWLRAGWAARTGYDPRGLGRGGFGNLTGYTPEEVAAVPVLSAGELLAYFEQARAAFGAYLPTMSEERLDGPVLSVPVTPPLSAYDIIRSFLADGLAHAGEIRAIRAMWERTRPASAP